MLQRLFIFFSGRKRHFSYPNKNEKYSNIEKQQKFIIIEFPGYRRRQKACKQVHNPVYFCHLIPYFSFSYYFFSKILLQNLWNFYRAVFLLVIFNYRP